LGWIENNDFAKILQPKMIVNKIALCSDHAGYELKEFLIKELSGKGYEIENFGTFSSQSCDYADFAHPMASSVEKNFCDLGIAVCGSGNGINMTVNKHQKIRGALCWKPEIAYLARLHNDANVCCLPARFVSNEIALEIVDTFLNTLFEGGRHSERIRKI